jgi:hypothetical protein
LCPENTLIRAHVIFRFDVAKERQRLKETGPQKLTRPDGEIRAGRFDRRRGSGGRERRSGLLFFL